MDFLDFSTDEEYLEAHLKRLDRGNADTIAASRMIMYYFNRHKGQAVHFAARYFLSLAHSQRIEVYRLLSRHLEDGDFNCLGENVNRQLLLYALKTLQGALNEQKGMWRWKKYVHGNPDSITAENAEIDRIRGLVGNCVKEEDPDDLCLPGELCDFVLAADDRTRTILVRLVSQMRKIKLCKQLPSVVSRNLIEENLGIGRNEVPFGASMPMFDGDRLIPLYQRGGLDFLLSEDAFYLGRIVEWISEVNNRQSF